MINKITIRPTLMGSLLLLALAILALAGLQGSVPSSGADELGPAGLGTNPVPILPLAAEREPGASIGTWANLAPAAPLIRTIPFSPGAFLYAQGGTDITMSVYWGLRWAASTDRAGFYMRRPADWKQTTPVKVKIYFLVGGSEAGTVNWRLKLNSYTPNNGEVLTNPASLDADAILNFTSGSSNRIYSQSFTLQPADFNDEPLWSLYFLRGDGTNGETFAGYLYVMLAEVEYEAVPPYEMRTFVADAAMKDASQVVAVPPGSGGVFAR